MVDDFVLRLLLELLVHLLQMYLRLLLFVDQLDHVIYVILKHDLILFLSTDLLNSALNFCRRLNSLSQFVYSAYKN